MTAPDDLARTLAEHWPVGTYEGPDSGDLWYPCKCGWDPPNCAEDELREHVAEHLASVVSRRDADLRTRALEDAADALDAVRIESGGEEQRFVGQLFACEWLRKHAVSEGAS